MASFKSKRRPPVAEQNQLRIIGGEWRSRKLSFTPAPGLRPTGDRIRETLFNWLSPVINGARCADLFAGSGALGLEALSRGAAHCDFVDTSLAACRQIQEHLVLLDAGERGNCHNFTATQFLKHNTAALDIVLIDPPFADGLIQPCVQGLAAGHSLAPAALIYVEAPIQEILTELPQGWTIHRHKNSGGVSYSLFATSDA